MELQYTNVIAKMELREVEVVDECKGGSPVRRGMVLGGNLVGSPFDWKTKSKITQSSDLKQCRDISSTDHLY